MKYACIKSNDIVDVKDGIAVSFWVQGCPHRCEGCHNPSTWDFNGGKEKDIDEIIEELYEDIISNGIKRDFSILGGEPLAEQNRADVCYIINNLRFKVPNLKIYLWTGYTKEALDKMNDTYIKSILSNIDILIDGPFILSQRDITLPLRGSCNQNIYQKNEQGEFVKLT